MNCDISYEEDSRHLWMIQHMRRIMHTIGDRIVLVPVLLNRDNQAILVIADSLEKEIPTKIDGVSANLLRMI